jgi:hypothetical protein
VDAQVHHIEVVTAELAHVLLDLAAQLLRQCSINQLVAERSGEK